MRRKSEVESTVKETFRKDLRGWVLYPTIGGHKGVMVLEGWSPKCHAVRNTTCEVRHEVGSEGSPRYRNGSLLAHL